MNRFYIPGRYNEHEHYNLRKLETDTYAQDTCGYTTAGRYTDNWLGGSDKRRCCGPAKTGRRQLRFLTWTEYSNTISRPV